MELPKVGSKWVAKVDKPRGATGVEKDDVIEVTHVSISYTGGWCCLGDHWHENFEPIETKKPPAELTAEGYTPKDIKEPSGKIASDGGSSAYYDFPEGCNTLNDLIEYKGMSFAQGNIFKAAYRLGNKEGITLEYDLKKIKYYADRMLAQIGETK